MQPYAKIIADSISPDGVRLTTMQVTLHRFVLAEFNTHRVFSRNSASSRAIPVRKTIERIQSDPAYPLSWPTEKPGMQGGPEISASLRIDARDAWFRAMGHAIKTVRDLTQGDEPIHKSVVNRLLEPFADHTIVVTATAWQNFFNLRLDVDAQPEIRVAAEAMKVAYDASTPQPLAEGQWHLPYVTFGHDDYDMATYLDPAAEQIPSPGEIKVGLAKVSAARCARTSYLTQDGHRDIGEDLRLYDRLVTERVGTGKGIHWSPLEHVATPWAWNRQEGCIHFGQEEHLVGIEDTFTCIPLDHLPRTGNLLGWRSLRTEVEATTGERTYA